MKNAILLTDFTDPVMLTRISGPYKVAHSLRQLGIKTTVINWLHMWDYDDLLEFLDQLINEETLFIGFHNLFYRNTQGQDIKNPDAHVKLAPNTPGCLLPFGSEQDEKFLSWLKDRQQTLVLGGPTAKDKSYNRHFDYILNGYTEKSIEKLVDHLINQAPLSNSYRSIYGPTIVQDINTEKNFEYATTTMRWDDQDCILPGETLNIEIARGCIFKCGFCHYPMIGKKKFDYIRTKETIQQELLDNYERFGTTRYIFTDETFNDSEHKIELINDISQSLPFKLEYFAWMRLDLLIKKPHTIDRLFESGLRYAHYGIETLNSRSGRTIGKTFTEKPVVDILEQIDKRTGGKIINHGTFIIGLPHCSKQHILDLYKKLETGALPLPSFNFFGLLIYRSGTEQESEFSKNFAKHGYWELQPDDPVWGDRVKELALFNPEILPWANKHMNCFEALDMQRFLEQDANRFRYLIPNAELSFASLGLDESQWRHRPFHAVDWRGFREAKNHRFAEYQQLLRDRCLS